MIKKFGNYSPEIFDTSPHKYRAKWKSVQEAANLFCEHFIREYVPPLQWRQKWLTNFQNFKENKLISLKDDHLSPLYWPPGRVTKVFQDKDSIVRSVDIKLPYNKIIRSSAKLCILEKFV